MMLGVLWCAPGPDVFWYGDLYVGSCFCILSFPHRDATVVIGGCLSSLNHDAPLMLGVFCCAPGPDVFWYRDLNQNLGACPGQDCRQRREGQDQLAAYLPAGHGSGSCSPSLCGGRRHVQHVRIRWLSYGFQCRDALCSHIQRWLWEVVFLFITSWCKSDVESVLLCPAARFFFDKVIFMWGVVFCILSFWLKDETVVMEGVSFYFPTSWCNSDVGRITFCLTSWCNSDDGICFLLCPWASLLQMRLSVMDVLSLCFLFHIKMQLWCWEDFFLPRIMILLWWDECHAVPLG